MRISIHNRLLNWNYAHTFSAAKKHRNAADNIESFPTHNQHTIILVRSGKMT